MADLTAKIHAATRLEHKSFNRLVVARLPLSLPPHASSPQLYSLGLTRFAEIYYAFEKAWLQQINASDTLVDAVKEDYDVLGSFINDNGGRIRNALRQIYLPKLLRSKRLRSDLRALRCPDAGTSQNATSGQDVPKRSTRRAEMAVKAFVSHIEDTVARKPHVLLAYAWLMYMALFNGGHWIRDRLIEGGPNFWTGPTFSSCKRARASSHGHDRRHLSASCLSFWFFDGEHESEDLKYDFKRRLDSAANLLTEMERAQVVAEAVEIFYRCEQIVLEIDLDIARGAYRNSRVLQSSSSTAPGSLSSSFLPQTIVRRPQAPPRTYIRPLLVGMAGVLGGLCAWFWRVNTEAAQWGYNSWLGEEDLIKYDNQRTFVSYFSD